ncbi:FG-GAP repeat domain-containing protein [Acidobacteriota bacterium]
MRPRIWYLCITLMLPVLVSTSVLADDEIPDTVMVIANLNDDNGDTVVDDNDVPDLIYHFIATNGDQVFRAVSGKGGSVLFEKQDRNHYWFPPFSHLAVGDIDSDGMPEIVSQFMEGGSVIRLVAYEHDGEFKWHSDPFEPLSYIPGAGMTFADLDDDGTIEILAGDDEFLRVYNSDGSFRWKSPGSRCSFACVADLDLDGSTDIVYGGTAYRKDGSILWSNPLVSGDCAIGEFDGDAHPEITVLGTRSIGTGWGFDIPVRMRSIGTGWGKTAPFSTRSIGSLWGSPVHILDQDGAILWSSIPIPAE